MPTKPYQLHALTLPITGSMQHENNFNFLRLFLAVLVLLAHSPELIDGNRDREILTRFFHTISFGELAVDAFFLISGYLILQSWQRSPQPSGFLKKRILRIYPGFIVATLISAFVVGPLGASAVDYFAQFNPINFLRGMLLLQPPSVPPVFAGQPYPRVNDSMWTISYEFRCYLLVAALGMWGLARRWIWLGLTALALVLVGYPEISSSITFKGSGVLIGNPVELIHFLSFFLAGGCFYIFRNQIRYSSIAALVLLPIALLGLFNMEVTRLLLPTVGAYILFWFAFTPLPILQRFEAYPDISYGVYLYGWPTQKLLLWYWPSLSPWLLFALSCVITFACGLCSWYLVEKPFLKLKKAGSQNRIIKIPQLPVKQEDVLNAEPTEVKGLNREQ